MRHLWLAVFALALTSYAPQPPANPAIWRLADSDSEIWLFGTVHVLPPDVAWRSDAVDAAFAGAETLVLETDTGDAALFQRLAASYGTLPEGQSLSARVGPNLAPRLRAVALELGVDPIALDRQRPWMAALQLSMMQLARAGHSADAGVETVLSGEAERAGKQLAFLETPEQQIRILADLPPDEELRFLAATIEEIERGDMDSVRAMDLAWARGDVAALRRQLDAQWAEAGPVVHDAVILNRNRAWADAIEEMLAGSGGVFIAVGAAHLVGDGSVVDLLRDRGHAVEGP